MAEKLELAALVQGFETGAADPHATLDSVYQRIEAMGARPIWIELLAKERATALLDAALERKKRGESLPLLGVPFAIKDNIDLAHVATTAGCPAYSYVPDQDAPVVARLIDAGAIPIGKTNMDQFATGLVGTRSPYGACASVCDERYISGGSSSGSALAVARDLVAFALGTDTAGSGRIPAAFNNLVGLKPTRGLCSTRGVVPACRSLDCVSVFASSVADSAQVLAVASGYDAQDPFSRAAASSPAAGNESFSFGVPKPEQLEFFGNHAYSHLYQQAVTRLVSLGGRAIEIDLTPFSEAARLLYAGPWVAERFAAVGEFIEQNPEAVNPIVRDIILEAKSLSAVDCFRAQYQLAILRRQADAVLVKLDFLLLPTAPTIYTLQQVEADPVGLNKNLGTYTNFVNLLDLAAVAVPAGFTAAGLPFGITLIGPAFADHALLGHAARFLGEKQSSTRGPSQSSEVLLAVAGAHLTGQPLNFQLTERGARLVKTTRTSPEYKLYALQGTVPPKPGVVFSPRFEGAGIEVEIWALSFDAFGSFVSHVTAPMTIGTATLADGSRVKSFLCEPFALSNARDITSFGGWRAYLEAAKS